MFDYSIIIPHKNTPQLLRKCLASIPKRDDIQIIVVDDNSDSDKVDFNNFPGVGDPHTEVYFTKEGKGAGYARNVGLSKATGKWIVFADADDYFLVDVNTAMDNYVDSDSDVIYFRRNTVRLDGNLVDSSASEYVDYALETGDYYRIKFWMSSPVSKFIRRAFLVNNSISFEEIRWSNDVMFSTKIGLMTEKVECSPLYIYRNVTRKGSLRQKNTLQSNYVRLLADCRSFDLMKQYGQYDGMRPVVGFTMDYWVEIFYEDKFMALRLIPKVVRTMGFKTWIKAINSNKRRLLRSFAH